MPGARREPVEEGATTARHEGGPTAPTADPTTCRVASPGRRGHRGPVGPTVVRVGAGSTLRVPVVRALQEGGVRPGRSICQCNSVSEPTLPPDATDLLEGVAAATRDLAEVPAVEVITTTAVHLMSAAAVKCGLADDEEANAHLDLDEARKLITALAALVTASAPDIGSQHAAPLRDGLKALQLAFREASPVPDAPGEGPGERFTGPVWG